MYQTFPEIYAITDTHLSGLSHIEQVKRLVAGGIKLIQLRDKTSAPREFYDAALKVIEFARSREITIIINDRVDIALALNADGVHLGQEDLPPAEARKLLGPGKIIGYSTHSIEQAVKALEMGVDYIAIGPVYTTATKHNPDPVVGLDLVRKVKAAVGDIPLVGIGGINAGNIKSVLKAGADSVAVISAIVSHADLIEANSRKLLNEVYHRSPLP